jgi:hypothetical protein
VWVPARIAVYVYVVTVCTYTAGCRPSNLKEVFMKFWLWLPLTMLMLSPFLWERIEDRIDGVAEGGSGFPTEYAEGGSGFPTK